MKRLAVAVLALALALGACAKTRAPAVLGETAVKLGTIRSGELVLSVDAGEHTGFRLEGLFSLPPEGGVPRAHLTYTRTAGDREATAVFRADGERAFVEIGEKRVRVPIDGLRARARPEGAFEEVDLERWVHEPQLSVGPEPDTERITGELDVVTMVNDFAELVGKFGIERPRIDEAERARVEAAVENAMIDVVTGTEDRLLRRVRLEVGFALDAPARVREALGALAGGSLALELEIRRPNEPVEIPAE